MSLPETPLGAHVSRMPLGFSGNLARWTIRQKPLGQFTPASTPASLLPRDRPSQRHPEMTPCLGQVIQAQLLTHPLIAASGMGATASPQAEAPHSVNKRFPLPLKFTTLDIGESSATEPAQTIRAALLPIINRRDEPDETIEKSSDRSPDPTPPPLQQRESTFTDDSPALPANDTDLLQPDMAAPSSAAAIAPASSNQASDLNQALIDSSESPACPSHEPMPPASSDIVSAVPPPSTEPHAAVEPLTGQPVVNDLQARANETVQPLQRFPSLTEPEPTVDTSPFLPDPLANTTPQVPSLLPSPETPQETFPPPFSETPETGDFSEFPESPDPPQPAETPPVQLRTQWPIESPTEPTDLTEPVEDDVESPLDLLQSPSVPLPELSRLADSSDPERSSLTDSLETDSLDDGPIQARFRELPAEPAPEIAPSDQSWVQPHLQQPPQTDSLESAPFTDASAVPSVAPPNLPSEIAPIAEPIDEIHRRSLDLRRGDGLPPSSPTDVQAAFQPVEPLNSQDVPSFLPPVTTEEEIATAPIFPIADPVIPRQNEAEPAQPFQQRFSLLPAIAPNEEESLSETDDPGVTSPIQPRSQSDGPASEILDEARSSVTPRSQTISPNDQPIMPQSPIRAKFLPLMPSLRHPLGPWGSVQDVVRRMRQRSEAEPKENIPIQPQLAGSDQRTEENPAQPNYPGSSTSETWASIEDLLAASQPAMQREPWEDQFALLTPTPKPDPAGTVQAKAAPAARDASDFITAKAFGAVAEPPRSSSQPSTQAPTSTIKLVNPLLETGVSDLAQSSEEALDEETLEQLAHILYKQVRDRLVLTQERYGCPNYYPPPWLTVTSQLHLSQQPTKKMATSDASGKSLWPSSPKANDFMQAVFLNLTQRLHNDRERHGF